MNGLALVLDNQNRFVEAEAIQRETFDVRKRVLGLDHPDTLASMATLAKILNHEHRYAESENLYRKALKIERRALGPEHPAVLSTLGNLANDVAASRRRSCSSRSQCSRSVSSRLVRDRDVDDAAALSESDIGDTELSGERRHGFGPDEVVERPTGQGEVVGGHGGE